MNQRIISDSVRRTIERMSHNSGLSEEQCELIYRFAVRNRYRRVREFFADLDEDALEDALATM